MPSKSKQQQKFMGMVHALQKGDMKPSDASPELKKVAKSMDKTDAKDYASTSHKGLPKKVKQEIVKKLKELNESVNQSDYLNGLKDLQKAVKSEKGSFQGNNGGKVAKLYYEKALKMGMDNNFIDNLTRKRINAYNKKAFSLSGGSLHTAVVGGIDLILKNINEYANKMGTNTMGGDSIPSAKKGGLRDFDGYDNVDYNKDMPMDEASSADAYKISRMLGTAQQSTQDFIDDNKIDVKKLELYIKKLSPSKKIIIKDIINGSTDSRLNNIKKGLIKQVKESIKENFPANWLQGRVSDYHTKKGTTPRDDYDDTNFNTKHSGQEDLEDEEPVNESSDTLVMLQLLNKAMSTMPNSPKQKEIIKKLNVLRVKNKMTPLKEWGAISQGYHLQPSQEDKLDGTPEDKMAIDEVGVFPIRTFLQDLIPGNIIKTTTPQDKERLKSTIKDLIFTLNKFWKQHDIPYRVKESVSEVAKRDYKAEYKKFQSSTKSKKYRAELNKYNRDKGTYGNGDGKDASHKGGKIVGFETESKNRGRAEKSRLKKKYDK